MASEGSVGEGAAGRRKFMSDLASRCRMGPFAALRRRCRAWACPLSKAGENAGGAGECHGSSINRRSACSCQPVADVRGCQSPLAVRRSQASLPRAQLLDEGMSKRSSAECQQRRRGREEKLCPGPYSPRDAGRVRHIFPEASRGGARLHQPGEEYRLVSADASVGGRQSPPVRKPMMTRYVLIPVADGGYDADHHSARSIGVAGADQVVCRAVFPDVMIRVCRRPSPGSRRAEHPKAASPADALEERVTRKNKADIKASRAKSRVSIARWYQ